MSLLCHFAGNSKTLCCLAPNVYRKETNLAITRNNVNFYFLSKAFWLNDVPAAAALFITVKLLVIVSGFRC